MLIRTTEPNGDIRLQDHDFFYKLCPVGLIIPKEEVESILSRYPVPALPEGMEVKGIDEFNAGEKVKNYLVLIDQLEIKPSSGSPYLSFRATNSRGSFMAKKWENKDEPNQQCLEMLTESPIVSVDGLVQEFPKGSGRKSFVMDRFQLYKDDIHPMSLLPTSKEDLESLTLEFFHYLYSLSEPIRTMALDIFDVYWSEYSLKPAAKSMHHNFIGGLLQHNVENMRLQNYFISSDNLERDLSSISLQLYKRHLIESMENRRQENPVYYNRMPWSGTFDHLTECIHNLLDSLKEKPINRDLSLFGESQHDIGKIFEYSNLGETNKFASLFPFASNANEYKPSMSAISMDPLGASMGHIPVGILVIQNYLMQNSSKVSLTKEEITELMNIILSHHAKGEWGSPVRPSYPSSWLLHIVDYLDSRYAQNQQ